MSFTLTSITQVRVEERMRAAGYVSPDEVVEAGLAALDQIESAALTPEVLDAIDAAEAQAERGRVHDWVDVREKVRDLFRGQGR